MPFNSSNIDNIEQLSNRGHLMTEQPNDYSTNLDQLSTESLVKLFSEEDLKPQIAVKNASNKIVEAIELISHQLNNGGRLFYIGAGTSGRLGVLDASECPPTFCTPPDLVQGVIAGGRKALQISSEEIEDDINASVNDLHQRRFTNKDCLIGISAGGTTPYVLNALKFAKNIGAKAIALACVPSKDAPMPNDIDIRLLTGPEILTGSTRLKAGTATKMALNIISTAVMVRLGKVYRNYMIDLSVTNDKLQDRALRILSEVADINRQEALKLLDDAEGSVKLALLMRLARIEKIQAVKLLEKNADNLQQAIFEQNSSIK